MDQFSDNTIPWHLISSALQGNINPEESAALQHWIASGVQNRELFIQLKNAWDNDLDELQAYLQADETVGWHALQGKLVEQEAAEEDSKIKTIAGTRKKRALLFTVLSVAAILVLVAGIWYMKAGSSRNFETAVAEQQSVTLADGSVIKLFPASSMEVPPNYNGSVRKVILKKGEAFFEVRHQEQKPFIVELGIASVKDVGTSFRIKKTNDSIHLVVMDGSVEFRNNTNGEVRLLMAGTQATLLTGAGNSGPLIVSDPVSDPGYSHNPLRFINTLLPEVIQQFRVEYKKQIMIDPAIAQKRFTGNLEGQSFDNAIDVLCRSLNITLVHKNDLYYLTKE